MIFFLSTVRMKNYINNYLNKTAELYSLLKYGPTNLTNKGLVGKLPLILMGLNPIK